MRIKKKRQREKEEKKKKSERKNGKRREKEWKERERRERKEMLQSPSIDQTHPQSKAVKKRDKLEQWVKERR